MPGPLEGLKVVDCSRGFAGTRSTGIFCDYGAEVIWVEPPGGDPFRETLATAYAFANRGKKSVELDLRQDSDRAVLFALLDEADVFVQSWRPGVARRLGVDYEALHSRFPGLVYASISGFGVDGPHRDTPGFEPIVQAV